MKPKFKVEKLELETLIDLLINLYENGIDYVDLASDNSNDFQDKLIIQTRDSYINPNWKEGELRDSIFIKNDEGDEDDIPRNSSTIEIQKLTDDDIDKLI